MNLQAIATCSQCGGDVVIPRVWAGVINPAPQCIQCGATAKTSPVIPTTPAPPPRKVQP